MGTWTFFPGLQSDVKRSSQDTSATLIMAVTGPILQPTLSVSLRLFPAPQTVVAACAVSRLQRRSAGRLSALPETLPATDPKPKGRNKVAASTFFFFFSILLVTVIITGLLKYYLSFVFTNRTGLLVQGICRRIILLFR